MTKKVKIPKVRFKGFSDDWKQRKLGEIVQITMGQSPYGSTYSDKPSKYILVQGNADLKDGYVCPRVWTTQATKIADAGDLIMSVRAPAGAMGKTNYKAVIGRGVAAIKGSEFIYQLLVKMDQTGFWRTFSCGSTFESLNSDNIKGADICAPNSVDEEKKNGQFFLELDSLITLHQRKVEFFSNTKKFLLNKMFPRNGVKIPEIRFAGFTKNWKQCRLGDEATFSKGQGYSKKDITGRGTPVILYGRLYTKYQTVIDEVDTFVNAKKDSIYSKGYEVIVPSSGETAEDIARASAVGKSGILLGGDLNIVYPSEDILPAFLALVISHGDTQKLLSRRAQGKSIVHLHNSDLEDVEICFPEKHEQMKITDLFCCMDNLVSFHHRKVEGLKNIKTFFLQNMFI